MVKYHDIAKLSMKLLLNNTIVLPLISAVKSQEKELLWRNLQLTLDQGSIGPIQDTKKRRKEEDRKCRRRWIEWGSERAWEWEEEGKEDAQKENGRPTAAAAVAEAPAAGSSPKGGLRRRRDVSNFGGWKPPLPPSVQASQSFRGDAIGVEGINHDVKWWKVAEKSGASKWEWPEESI